MWSLHQWIFNFDISFGLPREEVFGPVAPLMRFHSDEEAIKMANDTEFGMCITERDCVLDTLQVFEFRQQR